ncbi:hypothetical protein Nmel_006236, partial [Mimus melanotis]
MAVGIFQLYLVLMATVSTNQPSGKDGIAPEEDKGIVQRMKEQEVTLGQHQLCLEQGTAELKPGRSLWHGLWGTGEKDARAHLHRAGLGCPCGGRGL